MKELKAGSKILEFGDKIWVRDDLKKDCKYGAYQFDDRRRKGVLLTFEKVYWDGTIALAEEKYIYTPEMIDWDKTKKLYHDNKK